MLSPAGPLDVFNTHLHANYSHKVRAKAVSAAAAAAVATSGKGGSKAAAHTANLKTSAAATAGKAAGKAGMEAISAMAGRTGKTGKTAATAAGGDDGPLGFDVPLDAFAPFRVSQICELAQVRPVTEGFSRDGREGGGDGFKISVGNGRFRSLAAL